MWPNEVKMPSIDKCRERWSCRVRKKNGSSIRKTFNTKKEALAWGAQKELEIEQGQLSKIETISFAGACRLYLKLFTPHKAPSTQNYENITLGKICREAWANKPLHDLSAAKNSNLWGANWLANITRGTNDFAHCSHLIYLHNKHPNPALASWLGVGNKHYSDAHALTELIQWVWRSRIGNGEPITLYFAAKRMRQLFDAWLGINNH